MSASEQVAQFLQGLFSGFYATPPYISPSMVQDLLDELESSGEYVKVENIVDENTSKLIDQLTEQNKVLDHTATLYAEKIASVDFITLDRDTWRSRAVAAEREVERLSHQIARELS